ncbi:hypothetical protein [Granulicoccus phenolivorans]|uniref:hypothetical protein n=1 Tax=Granulicoccus phenolivorans TaxID=266854 RepID=UPI000409712A|nr:hypothetical protein [Granulicoccus phenolivorans]
MDNPVRAERAAVAGADTGVMSPSAHPRLRPEFPILQRTATSVQVGVDPAYALVLHGTDERIVAFLHGLDGTRDPTLLARQHDLEPTVTEPIIRALTRADILGGRPAALPPLTVRLIGAGLLARCFAESYLAADLGNLLLADAGRPDDGMYRYPQATGAATLRSHLLTAPPGIGPALDPRRVTVSDHWSIAGAVGDLTVVATDRLEPDRALTDQLLRLDQPHLLLRPLPDGVVLGPWVSPGHSACTRCVDLIRCADPAWPTVLAQLCRLTAQPPVEAAAWAAASAVIQIRAWQSGQPVEAANATIELDRGWVSRARHWPPHPDCGCRSLT